MTGQLSKAWLEETTALTHHIVTNDSLRRSLVSLAGGLGLNSRGLAPPLYDFLSTSILAYNGIYAVQNELGLDSPFPAHVLRPHARPATAVRRAQADQHLHPATTIQKRKGAVRRRSCDECLRTTAVAGQHVCEWRNGTEKQGNNLIVTCVLCNDRPVRGRAFLRKPANRRAWLDGHFFQAHPQLAAILPNEGRRGIAAAARHGFVWAIKQAKIHNLHVSTNHTLPVHRPFPKTDNPNADSPKAQLQIDIK